MTQDTTNPEAVEIPSMAGYIQKLLYEWDERKRYYSDSIEVEERYHHTAIVNNLAARKDELDKCASDLQRILNNTYLTPKNK